MIGRAVAKMKVVAHHYRVMGFGNATSYILQRASGRRQLTARLKGSNIEIHLRNDPYDTQIFTQIFVRNELDIGYLRAPRTIIDGGANIGLATLYLKMKYPDAKIVAIEPEPANFDLLVRNTKGLRDVVCLQNGIWNKSCRLQIIDNGDGNSSFVTRELSDGEAGENVVNAITLEDAMKRAGLDDIDLVKLDIEGSEKQVFESGYEGWLARAHNVIVEIHPHLQRDVDAIVSRAFERDFDRTRSGEYSVFSRRT